VQAPPQKVLCLEDMEDAVRAMPAWKQVRRLHAAALEQQLDQYIDPPSGCIQALFFELYTTTLL